MLTTCVFSARRRWSSASIEVICVRDMSLVFAVRSCRKRLERGNKECNDIQKPLKHNIYPLGTNIRPN
jgi:hypothetical protein